MNTSESNRIIARDLRIEENLFYAILEDGREIGVPYSWYWRLAEATPEERRNWRFIGQGEGIHWEDIDEDISIAGMLRGRPDNPAKPPRSVSEVRS